MSAHQKPLSSFRAGFVTGLAQMVTITGFRDSRPFPGTGKTAAEALRSDWEKLGGDMRRAAIRAAPGGKK